MAQGSECELGHAFGEKHREGDGREILSREKQIVVTIPIEPSGQVQLPASPGLKTQVRETRPRNEADSVSQGAHAKTHIRLLQVCRPTESSIEATDLKQDLSTPGHIASRRMFDIHFHLMIEATSDSSIKATYPSDRRTIGEGFGAGNCLDNASRDASHCRVVVCCQMRGEKAGIGNHIVIDK